MFHHPLRILVMAGADFPHSMFASLQAARLAPTVVASLGEFLNAAVRSGPDLLLLQHDLCGTHAAEICRSLRSVGETRNVPCLIFNCPPDPEARIEAIEAGADEWFDQDCDDREVLLRIQAAARRVNRPGNASVLRYSDVEMDLERKKVHRAGVLLSLPPIQFKLLRQLMESPTCVFSRAKLLEEVWKNPSLDERTVTVAMLRLRRILNATGRQNLIRTVLSTGYALDEEA